MINENLLVDLQTIRESLRELNDTLRDDVDSKLDIIDRRNKALALWINAISVQAKLVQTNLNIKESERLAKRFK